jgi:membrane protease YdiL (CAAX protease family)
MNHFVDWIKHHQIAAFFILTFAITWGLGFSYGAVYQQNQYLWLPLVFAATCGPALAGIMVTAITNAQPRQGKRISFWIAFGVAWIIAVLVCLANLKFIEHVPISLPLVVLFTVAMVPVPLIIASAFSRNPSLRTYLSSLVRLRGILGWALLALVGIPATILLAVPINTLLSKQPISASRFPEASLALLGLVTVKFFYQFFFFNATGEETGWRGFALPRLQSQTSPLMAALITGVFWTLWHFFYWQGQGLPVMTVDFWALMFPGHILLSVLITWIYNRAKGSLLVAGIAHAAANTVQAFLSNQIWGLCLVWAVVAFVLVLFDRMWRKLPTEHPAIVRETAKAE